MMTIVGKYELNKNYDIHKEEVFFLNNNNFISYFK